MATKKELANRLSLVKDDRDALYENYNEALSRLEKAEQELSDLREKINDAEKEIGVYYKSVCECLNTDTNEGIRMGIKQVRKIIRKHTGGGDV